MADEKRTASVGHVDEMRTMSVGHTDEKRTASIGHADEGVTPAAAHVLASHELMSDAIDGEARDHEMTLTQAVKRYPWACFWAFLMCFTIVMQVEQLCFANQSLMCDVGSPSTCS